MSNCDASVPTLPSNHEDANRDGKTFDNTIAIFAASRARAGSRTSRTTSR
jgi:hypothetical protein